MMPLILLLHLLVSMGIKQDKLWYCFAVVHNNSKYMDMYYCKVVRAETQREASTMFDQWVLSDPDAKGRLVKTSNTYLVYLIEDRSIMSRDNMSKHLKHFRQ